MDLFLVTSKYLFALGLGDLIIGNTVSMMSIQSFKQPFYVVSLFLKQLYFFIIGSLLAGANNFDKFLFANRKAHRKF